MNQEKLRWGVLGCADIARLRMIPAVAQSASGTMLAIASRNLNKARGTALEFGIPRAYGTYQELLDDKDIDAVYIPLPNHLHREWTIRAAAAGKHVLCEKPMALSASEAEEMAESCLSAGVHLAEAFMYRHHPQYRRVKDILASGEIGRIRSIRGSFTYNKADEAGNVRYKRHMGGGSLYDVGCYSISAARFLLESEPEAATVHAFFSPDHDGVDMYSAGILEFPGGISAMFDCGMWAGYRNTLEVMGSNGILTLPAGFVPDPLSPSVILVVTDGEERSESVPPAHAYTIMVDAFAVSVFGRTRPEFPSSDAVRGMRVLEACLASARTRSRVTLT